MAPPRLFSTFLKIQNAIPALSSKNIFGNRTLPKFALRRFSTSEPPAKSTTANSEEVTQAINGMGGEEVPEVKDMLMSLVVKMPEEMDSVETSALALAYFNKARRLIQSGLNSNLTDARTTLEHCLNEQKMFILNADQATSYQNKFYVQTLFSLAEVSFTLGDFEAAENFVRDSLDANIQIKGDDVFTGHLTNLLAQCALAVQKPDQAKDLLNQAISIQEKVFEGINSKKDTETTQRDVERAKEALLYLAFNLHDLANILLMEERFTDARPHLERSLMLSMSVLGGQENQVVLKSIRSLSICVKGLGDEKTADMLNKRAGEIETAIMLAEAESNKVDNDEDEDDEEGTEVFTSEESVEKRRRPKPDSTGGSNNTSPAGSESK
eukprot:GILJ01005059.1.p1 GENE.GILJ01005059.1~~GILJ01005059.1.p1  ORF type:complete len:426 (-),score=83.73 GILJ01005059.1:123-1268(-)